MPAWYALALSQSGAVAIRQLRALGLSPPSVGRLVQSGQLERLCRGIYVLPGMAPSWRQALWVASLRLGPEAVVSHRAAAALLQFDGVAEGRVELSIPHQRWAGDLPGAVIHRIRGDDLDDTRVVDGLPVTGAGRTLVDLGSVVDLDIVERALETALRRGLISISALNLMSPRWRGSGRMGPRALAQVLQRRPDGAPPTESDAETLFLQLVRRAGIEEPQRQFVLRLRGGVLRLDFAWLPLLLAVEIDGAATHASAAALQRDLRRQNRIVFGWMILRFTWADITFSPEYVISTLRAAWALLTTGLTPEFATSVSGGAPFPIINAR